MQKLISRGKADAPQFIIVNRRGLCTPRFPTCRCLPGMLRDQRHALRQFSCVAVEDDGAVADDACRDDAARAADAAYANGDEKMIMLKVLTRVNKRLSVITPVVVVVVVVVVVAAVAIAVAVSSGSSDSSSSELRL